MFLDVRRCYDTVVLQTWQLRLNYEFLGKVISGPFNIPSGIRGGDFVIAILSSLMMGKCWMT